MSMKFYNAKDYLLQKVQSLQPELAYDEGVSHVEWRAKATAKLKELLGLPFHQCPAQFTVTGRRSAAEYERIDFEFQSEKGLYIPCTMLKPLGQKEPLPTVICLQGHSSGKHISLGEAVYEGDERKIPGSDFALQAVREGYCAVAMDQRYMGVSEHDKNGNPGCIINNSALAAAMIGRTAIGERVWDIQRLIDVMEKYLSEYVDKNRILCMGNSGGGTASFYAAALEERICMAVCSCGVCSYEESIMAIAHCSCNHIPGIRKYFDMGDIGCLIAPRELLMVSGEKDEIFPIDGARKSYEKIRQAYRKLGREENIVFRIGDGGHRFYPDIVWPIVHSKIDEVRERRE